MIEMIETRRRTLVKTVTWRLIGIVWTWIGAYLILLLAPKRYRTAAALSTLIVAFHHSTRMAMYYGYERVWARIAWGRCEADSPLAGDVAWPVKLAWTAATITTIALLLALILYVAVTVKP